LLVGRARPALAGIKVHRLLSADEVDAACRRHLAGGRVDVAVVANPADTAAGMGGMAALAPWLAASKRAALVLTNAAGTDVAARVEEAGRRRALARLDALILLG